MNKKYYLLFSFICVIGFIIPFLLRQNSDSLNSTLSLSFTVLEALATIATLIVAILLFDKFGVDAKFKEKQLFEVIELASLLKQTSISATTDDFTYLIHRNRSSLTSLNDFDFYNEDKNKTVLVPRNEQKFIDSIFYMRKSYWLPKPIKDKLEFLNIRALLHIENPLSNEYIRFSFSSDVPGGWVQTYPKLTFEMFIINLHDLLQEIEQWLKSHSTISVDLDIS